MRRILPLLALLTFVATLSLAQTPPPGGPGGPPPGTPPPGGMPGRGAGMNPNFSPPPFPGDSTAAERDSLMNDVLKKIAGKEQSPAESVFKDIRIFKGRPAGQIPRVMNYGFGRALAVSCFHCHSKDGWDKDEKKQKRIAREMSKMAAAINSDYIGKIDGLGDGRTGPDGQPMRPTVNCSTCHRGSIRTSTPMMGGPGGPGGGRPGGPR